jgi:diphthamide synthase (EF-2-diphthine--ammonia ligase)
MAEVEMKALYPLWGRDTRALARTFIRLGFQAVLVCVDPRALPPDFAGRNFDAALLSDLPCKVDQCGENGEFHTFVFDGPLFRRAVGIRRGRIVERRNFVFAELSPIPSEMRPAKRKK